MGRHLQNALKEVGADNISCPPSREYDLRDPQDVRTLFQSIKPTLVYALAARVGGILDNKRVPADFYYDNILIGAYSYRACIEHGVRKMVNVGAGCGYPLGLKEPLREEDIWNGFPQEESAPYSLAKKMLILQGIAYRRQHGFSSITIIPSCSTSIWCSSRT